MLDDATRTFLEREIKHAQRPAGMSVHDGRVHIDASVIQRLMAMIEKLTSERDALREALEKLARLGNGDRYGNSIGNMTARDALAMGEGNE